MLEGMRKASQGTVGKLVMTIFMGLIIVSFAIWGVGDMLRGFSSDKVATVGAVTINSQQFSTALQNELYRLQRQLKQSISPAQARALGLDGQVLDRLIDEAALSEQARRMGLGLSDATIAEATRSDPRLKGADGQFDHNRFDAILRDSGLSERGFFAEQRQFYMRQQLEYSLVDGLPAPQALLDALQAQKTETRDIAYFTLPPAAVGDIPPPSADALKAFYDERKALWRAPEYRSFDALLVSPASLAKPETVSDEDAKAQYEKEKATVFTTPEKRKLQQIVYPTEAEANEGAAKIKDGTSFDDLAKSRNLSDADLDLGEVTKESAFDPAIGAAAFALTDGGTSGPVKGPFGYALVHVVSVTPGSVKPFDDVKADIKRDLATATAADDVTSLHDKIEDARASGKTLAEAAKSVGLETRSYAEIDREGKTPGGGDADVVDKSLLLPAVFASDVGVDDAAIPTPDHGYVWFSVTKIDPPRERPFDEVKDKVADAWRAKETDQRLADKAAELVKQLDAGGSIDDVAKAQNAEAKTAKDIRRSGGGGLAPAVAAAVFEMGPTGAGAATASDGRVVFKVTADVVPPPVAGDPGVATEADRLKNEMSQSVVEEYVNALKDRIGVKIDPRVMQSAEGG